MNATEEKRKRKEMKNAPEKTGLSRKRKEEKEKRKEEGKEGKEKEQEEGKTSPPEKKPPWGEKQNSPTRRKGKKDPQARPQNLAFKESDLDTRERKN